MPCLNLAFQQLGQAIFDHILKMTTTGDKWHASKQQCEQTEQSQLTFSMLLLKKFLKIMNSRESSTWNNTAHFHVLWPHSQRPFTVTWPVTVLIHTASRWDWNPSPVLFNNIPPITQRCLIWCQILPMQQSQI